MTTCNLSKIVSPAFAMPHRAMKNGEVNQLVLKGGRGSTKSSYASVEGGLLLLKNPQIHGVVMRKVSNTLRSTVYAQYIWAIEALGLYSQFKYTVSPMEITYKRTGQKLMFFGADDPGKLKSLKVKFGYIGYLHLEELDQFAGAAEVRNIEQSVLRGGPLAYEIKTFNPPRTRDNWANKYCMEEKPGQLIHSSTYLTTPTEWLGDHFISEAEHLKATDYESYEHEYLGIANGNGGSVFTKLELRTITNEELRRFDRIYQGIDWGWFPDKLAFIRLHYDAARNTIYLLDELYVNKMSNEDLANWIRRKGYHRDLTICDSQEPKSIADIRKLGVKADGAVKGPGSVEYGMKWLQRRKIVIDRKRTPNACKEFSEYEYERNRTGEIVSGYPDKNNHIIDATRYAPERLILSSKAIA